MRTLTIVITAFVLGAAGANRAIAADADVERVLEQLDQVGKNLREFSAKVRLTETDNAMGNNTVRAGQAYFQKKADGSARMHITFDKRIVGNKIFNADKTEYLLDGRWLTDRDYRKHNEVRREVLEPGQKMDLFKLGEGPFPLPIGQDPAQVHKVFEVQVIAPAKDDPRNSVHLRLTPKSGTELAGKFHVIDVWVDQATHMPVRVDTEDFKQQNSRSTELSDIVLNPPGGLKEADFQLPDISKEKWDVGVEPLKR